MVEQLAGAYIRCRRSNRAGSVRASQQRGKSASAFLIREHKVGTLWSAKRSRMTEKEDARLLPMDALHERHSGIVRLHGKGMGVMRIVEMTFLSYPAIG